MEILDSLKEEDSSGDSTENKIIGIKKEIKSIFLKNIDLLNLLGTNYTVPKK